MKEQFQRQKVEPCRIPETIRFKWSDTALEEGFVPFPKKLIRSMHQIFDKNCGMDELALLLAIVDFKRPSASRSPSVEFLAFLAGLTPEKTRDVLDELERRGMISIEKEHLGIEVNIDGFLEEIDKMTKEEHPKT